MALRAKQRTCLWPVATPALSPESGSEPLSPQPVVPACSPSPELRRPARVPVPLCGRSWARGSGGSVV